MLFTVSLIVATLLIPSCDRPCIIDKNWVHISSTKGDIPSPGPATQQTASLILDVDRDGVNDFIIGSRKKAPSVLWYQRTDSGWVKYVLDPDLLPIEAGGAFCDIDKDGDTDIVFGGDSSSNKVWWWENPYPDYHPAKPWKRFEIKNSGSKKHHDQIFGDFDGDGEDELVFWNQKANQLFIAEIPMDPQKTQPWPYTKIFNSPTESEGLAKVDMDGDGKLDIVGGGCWFKHQSANRYTSHIIDADERFTRAAAGQLKPGGRPEVVFVVGDGIGRLKWYEWTGSAWDGHDLLGFDVNHGHSLQLADFNSDGNLDIFCGEMRLHGKNKCLSAGDIDGDGDVDLLLGTKWLSNHGSSWELYDISRHDDRPDRNRLADMNGDGKLDAVVGFEAISKKGKLAWYENSSSSHSKWDEHLIANLIGPMSLDVTDMDRDGDLDIIVGEHNMKNPSKAKLFIYENKDGRGNSWQSHVVHTGDEHHDGARVTDIDNDGDFDIISIGWSHPNVILYENKAIENP